MNNGFKIYNNSGAPSGRSEPHTVRKFGNPGPKQFGCNLIVRAYVSPQCALRIELSKRKPNPTPNLENKSSVIAIGASLMLGVYAMAN